MLILWSRYEICRFHKKHDSYSGKYSNCDNCDNYDVTSLLHITLYFAFSMQWKMKWNIYMCVCVFFKRRFRFKSVLLVLSLMKSQCFFLSMFLQRWESVGNFSHDPLLLSAVKTLLVILDMTAMMDFFDRILFIFSPHYKHRAGSRGYWTTEVKVSHGGMEDREQTWSDLSDLSNLH